MYIKVNGPLPKQELGKISATTNMGPGTKGHTFNAPPITPPPGIQPSPHFNTNLHPHPT